MITDDDGRSNSDVRHPLSRHRPGERWRFARRVGAVALVLTSCALCSSPYRTPESWAWVNGALESWSSQQYERCTTALEAVKVGLPETELRRVVHESGARRGVGMLMDGFARHRDLMEVVGSRHGLAVHCKRVEEIEWQYWGIDPLGNLRGNSEATDTYFFELDQMGLVSNIRVEMMESIGD